MMPVMRIAVALSLATGLLVALCAAARADALVTGCASDTQPGAGTNLAQALAVGGIIRFACPAGTSIRVTGRYNLKSSTTLEGGDTVTLDGQGAAGTFLSSTVANNVILRRITIRGFANDPRRRLGELPGSVLRAEGPAELDRATIEANDAPLLVRGQATITDSAFVANGRGYAVVTGDKPAYVTRTRFTGNQAALLVNAGLVVDCDFSGQAEGAVRVGATAGPLEIRHSSFSSTRGGSALVLSQRSGAAGSQTITVRANVFQNNDGGPGGGAIDFVDIAQEARGTAEAPAVISALAALPPANFKFSYNTFTGNRGGSGGAISAQLAHTGGLVSVGDVFNGNTAAGDGGAIAVSGGALQLSHSLLKANSAGARGAALAIAADGQATVANALVISNTGPAGVISGTAVTLANDTIADNAASGLSLAGAGTRVANVILTRNHPADCTGGSPGIFSGANLQSDATCPGVTTGEAELDAFYVPVAGSPVLLAGDRKVCRADPVDGFDLAFQERLGTGFCALGAFEHPPLHKFTTSKTDRREAHATAQDDFKDEDGYRPPPEPTP